MTEGVAFSILLCPLLAFVVIGSSVLLRLNRLKSWAGYVTIATVGVSLVLSLWALYVVSGDGGSVGWELHDWLALGSLDIRVGFMMDGLTAIMLVVVNGVSLLVQIYSQGYMRGDNGYARYYAFMSLFTASMTGLVMAANVVQMFFFWELVGLCSYLLIGFWYHRPNAARAALKAFLVTRLGDIGFLLAIIYLFFQNQSFSDHGLNPLEIHDILRAVAIPGLLGSTAITLISLGIFCGAVGKSAQFPLHTWLPDAMEGPTPASALIHAATMVAAGVFLVARFFPLFEATGSIMMLVAITGGLTALLAASMALVMNDIKKVIAYSTISQLGYMMLALGIGAYPAAIFHLFNHAFFKALLFLGAGSVSHATGTFDMRFMGGLRKIQPFTYWTFVLASISLVGIFPLAGYWSKDEILAEAFLRRDLLGVSLFSIGLIGLVMTAMYITRVIMMTFHGEFRGGAEAERALSQSGTSGKHLDEPDQQKASVHLTESPTSMVLPMVILGGLSVGSGFIANSPIGIGALTPHWFSHLLVLPGTSFHAPGFVGWISVTAVTLGLLGIGVIPLVLRYQIDQSLVDRLGLVRKIVANRYYIDEFYERIVVGEIFYGVGSKILNWFDEVIVDGFVDLIAWFGRNTGRALAVVQSGQVQTYGSVFMIGIGIILIVYLVGS